MAYDGNQQVIELGKLYRVDALSQPDIQRDLTASIWVNSGSVDIHGSDSETQPATLDDMTLNAEDTGVEGKTVISTLTNYIAVKQNAGETTEIVLSGIYARLIGDIS